MSAYLFVHFIGEQKDGEQIYFSVSKDGLNWQDLQEDKPVLTSGIGTKGVRDPFLVRNEITGTYYLIATDLCIGNGISWADAQYRGSRDIIVWESTDLLHWSKERSCTVGPVGAGCVWAPESIFIKEREEFFVFWASMTKKEESEEPKQRIYGSYTKDFKTFSEPFVYLEAENHVIDMNIVEDNHYYYRFVKDETTKKVRLDRVNNIEDRNAIDIAEPVLDNLYAVEGPEAYRLPDGSWCLIVDQFGSGKGYLPLVTASLSDQPLQIAEPGSYNLGKLKKRHGGIIQISDQEYDNLKRFFLD